MKKLLIVLALLGCQEAAPRIDEPTGRLVSHRGQVEAFLCDSCWHSDVEGVVAIGSCARVVPSTNAIGMTTCNKATSNAANVLCLDCARELNRCARCFKLLNN